MKRYVFHERNKGHSVNAMEIAIPAWTQEKACDILEDIVGRDFTDLWVLVNPDEPVC